MIFLAKITKILLKYYSFITLCIFLFNHIKTISKLFDILSVHNIIKKECLILRHPFLFYFIYNATRKPTPIDLLDGVLLPRTEAGLLEPVQIQIPPLTTLSVLLYDSIVHSYVFPAKS